jgi:uncharacterized membrane protein YhaH (DUF805 family)
MEWMLMPLKRYADFSGRSRRMEFWMWQLFQVIVYILVVVLAMIVGAGGLMTGDPTAMAGAGGAALLIMGLYGIYALAVIVPSIAVAVRRLHDTNRSGWWFLAPIVPYVIGIVAAGTGVATGTEGGAATGGILALVSILAAVVLGLVLIVFYFLEGTKGPNKYGPDPKGRDAAEVFA